MTGVPYFVDSDIPSAVFLGLHLLVTDPSTSPRTPLGRAIFGVLYGLGVFGLYSLLGALGMPTFYDKLLCVPLLNLAVPAIDRAVRALGAEPICCIGSRSTVRSAAATSRTWRCGSAFFGVMTTTGAADGMHTGDSLPFWDAGVRREASRRRASGCCGSKRRTAATTPAGRATSSAATTSRARIVARDPDRAFAYFARACEAASRPAASTCSIRRRRAGANPRALDLRLLLREGGPNLLEMPEPELYRARLPSRLERLRARGRRD